MTRNFSLDLLRGLALYGILFVNVEMYFRPITTYGYVEECGLLESIILFFRDAFIQGKIVHLLSFLLGYGVAYSYQRSQSGARLLRRGYFLILLGMCHSFLWPGDILTFYGLITLVLYRFRHFTVLGLRWVGVICIAISIVIQICFIESKATQDPVLVSKYLASLPIWKFCIAKVYLSLTQMLGAIFWGWSLLGLACLGMWAQKRKTMPHSKVVFTLAIFSSLLFAVATTSDRYSLQSLIPLLSTLSAISLPFLYAQLATKNVPKNRVTIAIANVGKCGLTCYLSQTLVLTLIGTSYLIPALSEVSRIHHLWVGTAFFSLQVVVLNLWLKTYQGPVEMIQRRLINRT